MSVLTQEQTSLAEFNEPAATWADEFSPEDLKPKTPRERAARLSQIVGENYHKRDRYDHWKFNRTSLSAFFELAELFDQEDITSDFYPDDFPALSTFSKLCGEFFLRDADLLRFETWNTQPAVTLLRSFLRLSASFWRDPAPARPRRRRETLQECQQQGLSDNQIAALYNWRTSKGAPDLAKVSVAKRGEYTLTDADVWIDPPREDNVGTVKPPQLVFISELRSELKKKSVQ